jgi:hypothetical protein
LVVVATQKRSPGCYAGMRVAKMLLYGKAAVPNKP